MLPRVDVLGVEISAVNMEMTLDTVTTWVLSGDRQYVCVTGVHGVMESQRDTGLAAIHNNAGLTTPDGMPMVWAGKAAGARWIERVYGPDMMLRLLAEAQARGWSSFFYGGAPGVPELLAERLEDRFPGLLVAGTLSPPFRPLTRDEVEETAALINASGATLVWVGLSTPKQERWMAELRPLLEAPVLLGVGAAFDFHAGRIKQAPRWMQTSGLEWLYRLSREPRRLWRRYLRNNPRFVIAIMRRRPHLVSPAPNASTPTNVPEAIDDLQGL
jgi:N-acetylglucosaminyldiphosphoundecaprenol N-acetyl-beta-D-mannosaminyltransferase